MREKVLSHFKSISLMPSRIFFPRAFVTNDEIRRSSSVDQPNLLKTSFDLVSFVVVTLAALRHFIFQRLTDYNYAKQGNSSRNIIFKISFCTYGKLLIRILWKLTKKYHQQTRLVEKFLNN